MAKLIKVSETQAYRVGLIQMGKRKKGEEAKPVYLSIRQMYKTKKEPDRWKPGFKGITIEVSLVRRLVKAIKTVLADDKVEIIERG